ncbi:autotransporter outer membrane beta-barrel domain-containing protein [Neisseriaceae bacterium CLB008]
MKLSRVAVALSGIFAMAYPTVQAAQLPEGFPPKVATPNINDIINNAGYADAWAQVQDSWANTPNKNIKVSEQKFINGQTLTSSHQHQVIYFAKDSHLINSEIDSVQVTMNDSMSDLDVSSAIGTSIKGKEGQLGVLMLRYGTKAYDTVVGEYGSLTLDYDTEAYNTLVKKGGRQTLGGRSYAQANIIDGGTQTVGKGGLAEDNLIINGGQQLIYFDGGEVKNSHIGDGSYQLTSGLATDTHIYDGGYQLVYKSSGDGIGAKDTKIYEGGTQRVQYGEAHDSQVFGEQIISGQEGDWENGQWVAEDHWTSGAYPASRNATIYGPGTQTVGYYGGAYGTTIEGGTQRVNEFGDIANTKINKGGESHLAYGAFSRGALDVASGSVLMQGGDLHEWTDLNVGAKKGAYAKQLNLMGNEAALYIVHNADTAESVVSVDELINDGQVVFGHRDGRDEGRFSQLDIERLSGSGLFVMNTHLEGEQGDFLNVTESIDGRFDVRVRDSGQELKSNTADARAYHLIHANNSNSDHFTLVNGSVDLGAYKYYLNQDQADSDNWYLSPIKNEPGPNPDPDPNPDPSPNPDPKPDPKPDPSESTKNALALANVTPAIWNSELSTLRVRLGELRDDGAASTGVWSKAIASRHRVSGQAGYEQDLSGIMVGGDRAIELDDARLHLGGLFSFSHSKLDAEHSDGKVDSYALGLYATWLHNSGYYVDGVLKANRFNTENSARFNLGKTKAKDHTNGVGLSVEAGKHIKLNDYFVEPYVLASVFHGQKTAYQFDSGLSVQADAAESVRAEVGATMGKSFVTAKGGLIKPYLRLAVSHEFKKNNGVTINGTERFDHDVSGTVGKYGVGVTAMMNKQWAAYGELNYAKGNKTESPYGGSVGLRYSF